MNRHTPLAVLALSQLSIIGGAFAFHLWIRPDLLARNLPPDARERLAVAGWLVPWSVAIGTFVMVGAFFAKRGRSRLELVASGLVIASLPAVLVPLALFSAIFAG